MKSALLLLAVAMSSNAFAHRWTDAESYWQTIQFVDLNQDGKADVCGRDYDGLQCALSDGEAFGSLELWSAAFANSQGWGAADNWWKTIQFADVTGDGFPDVCARRSDGIVCGVSDGHSFGPLTVWSDEYQNSGAWHTDPSYWSTIRFPDLNGDGKADVCGRGIYGLLCGVSTGSAFTHSTIWSNSFRNGTSFERAPNYMTIQFVDLNGDGMADACGRGVVGAVCAISTGESFQAGGKWSQHYSDGGSWQIPRYALNVVFPDVNGDGKADVCGRGQVAIYCQPGDGATFTTIGQWTMNFSDTEGWGAQESNWSTLRYSDVNGDGKSDVCGRNELGLWCGLASESRFQTSVWSPSFSNAEGWTSERYYWQTIRFADLNGDGKTDVCGRFFDGMRCALSSGAAFGSVTVWSPQFSD